MKTRIGSVVLSLIVSVLLGGCPTIDQRIRYAQQQRENNNKCHEFILPVPVTSMGDQCPRTDQRAEITGGFVVCHCGTAPMDGGP